MANLKKTMAMAMATTALGATLIAGGSFAIFTSSVQNTGNTFAAGELKIGLDKEDANGAKYFTLENWAPGDSDIQRVVVTNKGSLELRYDLTLAVGGDLGGGANPVTIKAYSDAAGTTALTVTDRVLAVGASETIYVKVEFPKAAGNEYQGKSGTASIKVDAEQTKNN
ncbi:MULTISPECIES: TasA family protein [unclassified Paenibacillus]|uniref:TasA family protein n=1 Tax=unclassified Paenibacillus TaxID=185978 RepID=UPI0024065FA2|nr:MULTISPECIES: TasA family protein [unclassified Paenibacillus]MDF9840926.1 putative ribosomally synthesized peptide with SipW-like signal peptide [Paenibacillus sp. PastF-2]MDF9847510.1 putative ribosomally synthesized peptide with SipW-like signal peptide [Paenibacillus sp. PastM-2]MDF9853914.1 putative ribosomally synthesized peptide with SipW-like signal peptide [Paenibacillus sp. PastF-1]MDH6479185.1 putative ribosomally synthesized peptide with SipW-like signal peptide [Paenibacillus sp